MDILSGISARLVYEVGGEDDDGPDEGTLCGCPVVDAGGPQEDMLERTLGTSLLVEDG